MKIRSALGLVAGLLILLSSGAHTILGWRGISTQLVEARVPADLVTNLHIVWQWGGAVMVAIGLVVVATFLRRLRGQVVSDLPIMAFAAVYVLFGIWATVTAREMPGAPAFFLSVFVLPGILMAIAAAPVSGTTR